MMSAVRYKGQKLYHLALQGAEVDRPARDINIYELELLDFKEDEITFRTKVSKGTYIRVLGPEIAEKLGNIGHLTSLRRTKVGPFNIEDACDLFDLTEEKLMTMYQTLSFMDIEEVDDKTAFHASHGVVFNENKFKKHDKMFLVVDKNHLVIAIYKYENGRFICQRGLNDYGDRTV